MIGLDTNILVRYFAQDDPAQAAKATRIIEEELTTRNPGFVGAIVLVELGWVLRRLYKLDQTQWVTILETLLQAPELQIDRREEALKALQLVKSENLDFADAFLANINVAHGCTYTLTFDKKATRCKLFKLV